MEALVLPIAIILVLLAMLGCLSLKGITTSIQKGITNRLRDVLALGQTGAALMLAVPADFLWSRVIWLWTYPHPTQGGRLGTKAAAIVVAIPSLILYSLAWIIHPASFKKKWKK